MPKRVVKNDLPFNETAEKAVLGIALLNRESLSVILSSVQEEDFYLYKHQMIFRAIYNLYEQKTTPDILTTTNELNNMKLIDDVGGVDYLQEITEDVISFANLQFYINILIDQSVLRKMLQTIRFIDNTYKTEKIENINDFILNSEMLFKESIARRHISSFIDLKTATSTIEAQLNMQKELPPSDVIGLSTGYPGIDHYTQGFQRGEVTIVAARPSVGKTALCLNFAYQVASKEKVPVAIFSSEMNVESLTRRFIAMVSQVSLTSITTGHFKSSERVRVNNAIRELSTLKIFIDETSNIKIMDLLAKTRKLQNEEPNLGLVVIDYLGLIRSQGKSNNESRTEEVRKISSEIKSMAKDLKIPVVVVSQLSRSVEKRDVKRPMLSDLRDSGDIEQDADVVMLLYRPDYYKDQKKATDTNKKLNQMSDADRLAAANEMKEKELAESLPLDVSDVEVNIAKNRNGATGKAYLHFYKSFGSFNTPSKEYLEAKKRIEEED